MPKESIFANAEEAANSMKLYFTVSSALNFAEHGTFILFAMALLAFFWNRLRVVSPASNKSLEPTAGRRDAQI